jgi:SAM-dependent methyltransferase
VVVDFGLTPLANAYRTADDLGRMEPFYPLRLLLCEACTLVQLEPVESPEHIFGDYAYFSSYSTTWLDHARRYADAMVAALGLDRHRQVVEVASNDGYLLQYFAARGVPVLGVEPAANVAAAARARGIPTVERFFGRKVAEELAGGVRADLLVANNVLAHVPDLDDFVGGLARLLAPSGLLTLEFPHLARLLAENQFDTIYHEHGSYFSLAVAERLLAAHDLVVVDVEELPTHGGSLRVHARHAAAGAPATPRVAALRAREADAGLERVETYLAFGERVRETKRALLELLITLKRDGRRIVGYGAAAKATTLLNYCGIRTDFLDFVADKSPHKQGRFVPGTHLPIVAPGRIAETRPDCVLLLSWNLAAEIMRELAGVREWGGQFLIPIPEAKLT